MMHVWPARKSEKEVKSTEALQADSAQVTGGKLAARGAEDSTAWLLVAVLHEAPGPSEDIVFFRAVYVGEEGAGACAGAGSDAAAPGTPSGGLPGLPPGLPYSPASLQCSPTKTPHAAGGGRWRQRRCPWRCRGTWCAERRPTWAATRASLLPGKPAVASNKDPACGRRRALAPAEVSAEVLRHLVRRAEAYLGSAVDGAVIAVPAHFDAAQRAATAEAGRLAGLASVQLLQGAPG